MKKLSKKAKGFLKKCQQGGLYSDPSEQFDWEIWNSANNPGDAAQTPFLSPNQVNENKLKVQPEKESSGMDFLNAIPAVGKLAIGIGSIIGAGKQRREAKKLQKMFDEDTKRRMEEGRTNNFYATPYTTGRYSNYGKSFSAFQQGGLTDQVDLFTQMYNQKEQEQSQSFNSINDFYEQIVNNKKQKAKDMNQQGFQNVGSGIMEGLKFFLQSGGKIPLTKDEKRQDLKKPMNQILRPQTMIASTKLNSSKSKSKDRFREKQEGGEIDDLYSSEFQSPWNSVEQVSQEPSETFLDSVQNWIFEEDEPTKDYTINDMYFNPQYYQEEAPINSVVTKLSAMGLNPSSVMSGKHNEGSKHYEGKALDLGLNTTFGGDEKKMQAFYNFLNSEEGRKQFPNIKVRDERTKPSGQKVWSGSHLHLEIN